MLTLQLKSRTCAILVLFGLLSLAVDRTEAQETSAFPKPDSIKGLQVQMVDDAIKLGVRHAAINFALNGMFAEKDHPSSAKWESNGKTYYFSTTYLAHIDHQVKTLSDAGLVVYLIILAMPTGNPSIDALVIHPQAQKDRSYTVASSNVQSQDARDWLRAASEFLAARYSGIETPYGRVWGWIIGNEVNSHHMWHYRGPSTLDDLVDEYETIVRIWNQSIRKSSNQARVYLSLDHHWSQAHTPKEPSKSVPGKDLINAFAKLAKQRGDFDWNLAYHPYHSNLFRVDLWADPQAPLRDDTPKITFKNLEILCKYMQTPELLYNNQPRSIILSEQGFHSNQKPESELQQAAAYAYAWEKCQRLPLIEAFIYHRHVDHSQEGGLRLGLWRNIPGSIADPESPKPIYNLFLKAGTPQWRPAADELLPITGLGSWDQVMTEK
ncbi:MAG: DUF5722 domain-containing protein [Pirellula sp.]